MTTALHYDPLYLNHDTGTGHPECPERLSVSMNYLRSQPWFDALHMVQGGLADIQWISTVHDPAYIKHASETCKSGMPFLDSMDVSVCRDSFDIALQASGSVLKLADEIASGAADNGFALIRPPGHHAEHDMALGFCVFNNVAVLARYLQKQYKLDKILILDWDVHHGNGTQHTFEEDPSVLYISTHQYPYYPGTGAWDEQGIDRGLGATLNCPMPAGAGNREYESAFREKILPKIDLFKPEFIIISAGFDAHQNDPLGQINLTTDFYAWMTRELMEKADKYSGGRILSVLEGGYNLKKLPECIGTHIQTMAGIPA